MSTITLSIPKELRKEMAKSKFINWSAVAREAIREKAAQLRILDSIAVKSKLSEEDALLLGSKINKALHERYVKLRSEAH